VVWVLFGFTVPSLLLLRPLFTSGSCFCTALISDSSRSVAICSFLVVGVDSRPYRNCLFGSDSLQ
ncbi:hypothetical protein A2U01_0103854, partial [Trifolium medium]|nr:hypothetical protein [Trifolium medium]